MGSKLCKPYLKAQNTTVQAVSIEPTLRSALELILKSPNVVPYLI